MKIFSVRKREPALGPFPVERLRRSDSAATTVPSSPVEKVSREALLARCATDWLRLTADWRDAPVASELAPMDHSPPSLTRELKAAAYFLDASMVAICSADPTRAAEHNRSCSTSLQADRPHYALVMLIEHPRVPEKGNPARDWIAGAEDTHATLRGSEVAVVLASYLRWLGYPARAHFTTASEVDLSALAVRCGLAEVLGGRLVNPFVGEAFGLAAVITDAPLVADRPLEPRRWRVLDRGPGYWLGRGGALSGLERWRQRRRPTHLSRFPMERLRRRATPTTRVEEDAVPRVPQRANFFVRAGFGDLGEKAQREVKRFASKHPFAAAMDALTAARVGLQGGETTARSDAAGTHNPAANSRAVKSLCYALGADLVGICEAKPYTWYSHDTRGNAIEPTHRYAIVMLFDQGYATMEGSSGDDWISGAQSLRAYMRGQLVGSVAASMLRALGHDSRCHSAYHGEVLEIPLILLAGLGELSRIGELVLNPFVGPRFKSAVITTNLELETDRPIDFGLQDMCNKCMKCARECPCDAISWGDKVMFNGYEMWKPDVERCARYRITNQRGSACGRCMKTCPYNHEGLLVHGLLLWLAIHVPWSRRWIARLDDRVGNGRRVALQKWWSDLEIVAGRVRAPRGANRRELDPVKKLDPSKQTIAYYPATSMPRADQLGAVPIERKSAISIKLPRADEAPGPAARPGPSAKEIEEP